MRALDQRRIEIETKHKFMQLDRDRSGELEAQEVLDGMESSELVRFTHPEDLEYPKDEL
jgi:hypothetical protein